LRNLIDGLSVLQYYPGAIVDEHYGSPGVFVTAGYEPGQPTKPLIVESWDKLTLEDLDWKFDGVAWVWHSE
jgi:hypothetical protein